MPIWHSLLCPFVFQHFLGVHLDFPGCNNPRKRTNGPWKIAAGRGLRILLKCPPFLGGVSSRVFLAPEGPNLSTWVSWVSWPSKRENIWKHDSIWKSVSFLQVIQAFKVALEGTSRGPNCSLGYRRVTIYLSKLAVFKWVTGVITPNKWNYNPTYNC